MESEAYLNPCDFYTLADSIRNWQKHGDYREIASSPETHYFDGDGNPSPEVAVAISRNCFQVPDSAKERVEWVPYNRRHATCSQIREAMNRFYRDNISTNSSSLFRDIGRSDDEENSRLADQVIQWVRSEPASSFPFKA